MVKNILHYSLLLFLILVTKSSIAGVWVVPTGSMEPTIEIQDRFISNQLAYRLKLPFSKASLLRWGEPSRGEIIAFAYPEDESIMFVKRVIGIPGDHVEMKDGNLILNGEVIPQGSMQIHGLFSEKISSSCEYTVKHQDGLPNGNFAPIVVPEDQYFVLGDNRENSRDSRYWGFVPYENIEGKLVFRWLTIKSNEIGTFWKRLGPMNC